VFTADVIEKNTQVVPGAGNSTTAPHTASGRRISGAGILPEPEAIGSQGGNVGMVDGSISWRRQAAMHPRAVRWLNQGATTDSGHAIGYW